MKQIVLLILSILIFTGCSHYKPVPENYKGEVSYIEDTAKLQSEHKCDFFSAIEYNDKTIESNLYKTLNENTTVIYNGKVHFISPKYVKREIPTQPAKIKIIARSVYVPKAMELINPVYFIEKEFEFYPKPNQSYYVSGRLEKNYSAVWLAEAGTNKIIAKEEIHGSSSLNLFVK